MQLLPNGNQTLMIIVLFMLDKILHTKKIF